MSGANSRRVDVERPFSIAASVHSRRFGDETVLLDLEGGKYFALDEVGAAVWEALGRGQTINQIVDSLHELYDTTVPTLQHDVEQLVRALICEGLVSQAAP
jgi:hypothetical protein